MRIVHVLTRFLRAGTEENTAITCNGQVAAGHQVWAIYGAEFEDRALDLLDDRVGRICIPSLVHQPDLVNDVAALLKLTAKFRQLNADVVHTHQSKAGALGRAAAKLAGVPHVIHGVHIVPFMNAPPVEASVYRSIERLLAPWTDAFIHVAPALREACIRAGVGKPYQHHIVPSGMDVDAFMSSSLPADATALTAPIGFGATRPLLVLMVAALEPRKRHLPFLQVFRAVVDQEPNTRLLLAGVGSEEGAIRAEVDRLRLTDNVALLGLRNDVPALVKLADVGVLASEREGLARSVIQYALGGLPIVAPNLPGIERVVRNGVNGFLCSPDNLAELRPGLVAILQDELLRYRMGRASSEVDLSDWAGERMVERIASVYTSLGADRPVPSTGIDEGRRAQA